MVNIKGEDFFKYSAASMQAQVLKTKYWLEGYAICNFEDMYYWQAMPLSDLFYYNDNTIKTAGMQPVCDIGTLETISFFIVLTPQLNALGLQPVSCIFKTGTNIEISHVIVMHLQSLEYYQVPISELSMLTEKLPFTNTKSSIASPIKLFCEELQ